ncbi:STAS-like domain-containing protein [Iningainema sp. BLCCT55]|uniref:STAS-like domain-containing protein n=2 Tax=Iningainema TaxID=1932705 RepID=A0A8J6XR23_9CYAN|nr:STAS-like domain-containing protein [Iningainema tapete]MBD2775866.1 STAS-like domain-containing protein [Iningainema tapete BLCC-T55]
MKYDIRNLISENCMTPDEGQKLYNLIHPELLANHPIELDFAGVDIFASPFFNFAIGQLHRDISSEDINRLLKVSNLNPLGRQVLNRVIENSKRYYSNEHIRQAVDEVLKEQAVSV